VPSRTDKPNRTWDIYEHDQLVFEVQQGTRTWELHSDDYDTDQEFLAAAENELAALAWAADRLGRGFTFLPIKVEVTPGRFETLAFRFQDGFVPAAKTGPVVEQEVVEPVAEPEAAAAAA
jgi:hypothetical protein